MPTTVARPDRDSAAPAPRARGVGGRIRRHGGVVPPSSLSLIEAGLRERDQVRRNIGLVFQEVNQLSEAEVAAFVQEAVKATGAASPILTKAHIESIMRPRRNRALTLMERWLSG